MGAVVRRVTRSPVTVKGQTIVPLYRFIVIKPLPSIAATLAECAKRLVLFKPPVTTSA